MRSEIIVKKNIKRIGFVFIIIVLVSISFESYSKININESTNREGNSKFEYKIIPSFGFAYQKQFFSEVSIIYGSAEKSIGGAYLFGVKGGLEFNYDKDNFIIAPKIGVEFSTLLCLRLSLARFSTSNKADYYLIPEIGLGASLANLTYGYNVLMSKSTIDNISKHRISLTFNIF